MSELVWLFLLFAQSATPAAGPIPPRTVTNAQCATCRADVEIGHAASEERMSRAEIVSNVQARHHSGDLFAWLLHLEQIADDVASGERTRIAPISSPLDLPM